MRKLIMNEVYIGTAAQNKSKVIATGTGRAVPLPREEWIVVPNAHEPLVSESDFRKAQQIFAKRKYFNTPEHVFGNKVKCPACGHAMTRYTKQNPRFKCGTAKLTDHYGCRTHTILQSDIEKVVLAAVRVYCDTLIDREELKLAQLQKCKSSRKELEKRIASEEKAIEMLEASVTKIFTSFSKQKITQDTFLHKKSIVNDAIARKRAAIDAYSETLCGLTTGRDATENALSELNELRTLDTLNRAIVDRLIDKILVHDENDIEIVWKGTQSE